LLVWNRLEIQTGFELHPTAPKIVTTESVGDPIAAKLAQPIRTVPNTASGFSFPLQLSRSVVPNVPKKRVKTKPAEAV
jgi:hypothetical protein